MRHVIKKRVVTQTVAIKNGGRIEDRLGKGEEERTCNHQTVTLQKKQASDNEIKAPSL